MSIEEQDVVVSPLCGPTGKDRGTLRVTVEYEVKSDGEVVLADEGSASTIFDGLAWEQEIIWAAAAVLVKQFGRSAEPDGEVAEALRTAIANLDRLK